MAGIVLTAKMIEDASQEMSEVKPYGYDDYRKVDGAWVLHSRLMVDKANRRSIRVFADSSVEPQIIPWAKVD